MADLLRGPVFPAGMGALARQGVNVSAGWQLSQVVEYNTTICSVKQITLDHTHYENIEGCFATTEFYGNVFRPTIHREIYPFEDLPRSFAELEANVQTGIPIVRVAEEMPASVQHLLANSAFA